MSLKENEIFKGFYEIKGYKNYLVSKDGEVYSKIKKTLLKGSINPDGYHNFRLTDDTGYTYTFGLHRLLCYVFKESTYFEGAVANHKDGVKSNNSLDNLEWVTYKRNAEHAGEHNLTTKCLPVQVKDLKLNKILYFPSIIECARYYKVSKDFINWRCKHDDERLWPEFRQYRLNISDKPWKRFEDIEKNLQTIGINKVVCVKFLKNNIVKTYRSQNDAAIDLNVSFSTISKWLKRKDQPVLPGLIQMKYFTDITPWRHISDPFLELEFFTKSKIVKIIDSKTNETKMFESASACSKELNIFPSTLNYRLNANSKKPDKDGYIYNYYTNTVRSHSNM